MKYYRGFSSLSIIGILLLFCCRAESMIFQLPVQNTSISRSGSQSTMSAIDFENASFYEYIQDMVRRLGIAMVIVDNFLEPSSFSIHQEAPDSRQDLLRLFIDVLHDYNALLVKKDGILQIIPRPNDISEEFEPVINLDQIDRPSEPNRTVVPKITGSRISMNFKGLTLNNLLNGIDSVLGLSPIEIDPGVGGYVTLFSSSPISEEETFQVLIAILKNNDAVLIGSGMRYRVIKASKDIPTGWDLVTHLPVPDAHQILQ